MSLFLLKPDMWKKCLDCIEELLSILFEHSNIFIGENIAEDSENLANLDQVVHHVVFFLKWQLAEFAINFQVILWVQWRSVIHWYY